MHNFELKKNLKHFSNIGFTHFAHGKFKKLVLIVTEI